MDFSGKNVLITGGSRGIGRATALAFADRGARIAVNFRRDNEAAKATVGKLAGDGHFAIRADIGSPHAVQQMMEAVVREFGRLDIVVNNAGVFRHHPLEETAYQDWQMAWQAMLEINLAGPANVCY